MNKVTASKAICSILDSYGMIFTQEKASEVSPLNNKNALYPINQPLYAESTHCF